jgi:hypothetical protein
MRSQAKQFANGGETPSAEAYLKRLAQTREPKRPICGRAKSRRQGVQGELKLSIF